MDMGASRCDWCSLRRSVEFVDGIFLSWERADSANPLLERFSGPSPVRDLIGPGMPDKTVASVNTHTRGQLDLPRPTVPATKESHLEHLPCMVILSKSPGRFGGFLGEPVGCRRSRQQPLRSGRPTPSTPRARSSGPQRRPCPVRRSQPRATAPARSSPPRRSMRTMRHSG